MLLSLIKPKILFSGAKPYESLLIGQILGPTILRVTLTLFSMEKVQKWPFFGGNQQLLNPKNTVNQNFHSAKIVNLNI